MKPKKVRQFRRNVWIATDIFINEAGQKTYTNYCYDNEPSRDPAEYIPGVRYIGKVMALSNRLKSVDKIGYFKVPTKVKITLEFVEDEYNNNSVKY